MSAAQLMFAIPACPHLTLLHLRARRLRPKFQETIAIARARRLHGVVATLLRMVATTIVENLLLRVIIAHAVTLVIVVAPLILVTTITIATMAVAIAHLHFAAMLVVLQSATPIQFPATMSVLILMLLRSPVIAMTTLLTLRPVIHDVRGLRAIITWNVRGTGDFVLLPCFCTCFIEVFCLFSAVLIGYHDWLMMIE